MINSGNHIVFPRWIVIIFTTFILSLLCIGFLFFKAQQTHQRRIVESRLMDIAHLKARQIADWRAERLADAAVLMERRSLMTSIERFLMTSSEWEASEIKRRFRPIIERYHFADILLVDYEKHVRLSMSGKMDLHQEFNATLEEAMTVRKPVWTSLHREPEYSFPHLSVVTPLFTQKNDQELLATVIMICNAKQFLYPLIQSWPTPSKTAETLLIRQEGHEVLFLNDLRHRTDTALKLRIPVSRAEFPSAMAVQGQTGIVEGKDYRGIDVLAAVLPVPDSPWFIVSKMDADEAFADWHFRSLLILLLIAGIVCLVIVSGLVFRQRYLRTYYQKLYHSEEALRVSMEKHAVTLNSIGDAVISTNSAGQVELMNPVAERLTGWTEENACGQSLTDVFIIVNEKTKESLEDPVAKVIREGGVIGLANRTILIAKDGREIPIAYSGAPIRDENSVIIGVVLVFRDQSKERLARHLREFRLDLVDYAADHTLDELITLSLDRIGAFVNSPVGFFHMMDIEMKLLSHQKWPNKNWIEFCRGKNKSLHDRFDQHDAWKECIDHKKPVIKNDYRSFHKKNGPPENCAAVIRQMVIPIIREDRAVAIIGVRNKPRDYTEKDAELVRHLADAAWEVIHKKQSETALVASEKRLMTAQRIAKMGDFTWNVQTDEVIWSDTMCDLLGYDPSEMDNHNLISENIHHPDDEERLKDWLNACVVSRKNELKPIELRLIRKNGESIYVLIEGVIERRIDQSRTVFATVQDVTEWKKHEKEYKQLIDGMNDTAFVIDFHGKFVEVNETAVKALGYSREELLTMGPIDIDPHLSKDEINDLIIGMKRGERQVFETRHRAKDGKEIPVEISSSLVTYRGEKAILSVVRDITKRKLAEEDLDRVMEGAQAILWHSPVIRQKGKKRTGQEFLWKTHYLNLDSIKETIPLQDHPSHNLDNMYYFSILEEDRKAMDRVSSEAIKHGADRYNQEFRLRDANGIIHWMYEDARVKQMSEIHFEAVGVIIDITERKQAEETLRLVNERLRILHRITEAVHESLDLNVIFKHITTAAVESLGFSTAIILTLDKKDESYHMRSFHSSRVNVAMVNKVLGLPIKDTMFTSYQMNERIIKSAFDGKIVITNHPSDIMPSTISKSACKAVEKLSNSKSYILVPLILEKKMIGALIVSSIMEQVPKEDIDMLNIFAKTIIQAISNASLHEQTNKAKELVQNNLKEKEILLRELYHRTKNNMQVISSLLRLRARTLPDENMKFTFREIENKIRSMALVHQKLYESKDLSSLNLKYYFNDLISLIQQSFLTKKNRIKFTYDAVDVPVLIDTAVPLGLILNELLSNAVKHAFPEGRNGEIHVKLDASSRKGIIIEVSDNGIGLPEGFRVETHAHLGLDTVVELTKHQLKGEVFFQSKNGLKCQIKLKKELYRPRI
ncbi:PAS domain S-box protein [bacterium]|nr:PAS domain S-box protein [bacterium]